MLETLGVAALAVFLYMCGIFIFSLIVKDNSIVDVAWGGGFVLVSAATFLGGTGTEGRNKICVTGSGDVCMSGYTVSRDFPVSPGVFQGNPAGEGWSVFVMAMSRDLLSSDKSSLHDSAKGGDLARIKVWTEQNPSEVDAEDVYQRTPLHWACRYGRAEP